MEDIRIIELKESILADNDADADKLRSELDAKGIIYVNVMSSPGSGKTSTLLRLIEELSCRYGVGVLEADIDGDVDTRTMLDAGVPAVQLHTGGMCHLDADMSRQGLRELESQAKEQGALLDLVFLENVGNLVCPAEFDTGAHINLVILSVPEGDDKPLKYPLMFEKADVIVVNKIDAMEAFDFIPDRFKANVAECSEDTPVFMMSAATKEGMHALAEWISDRVREKRD